MGVEDEHKWLCVVFHNLLLGILLLYHDISLRILSSDWEVILVIVCQFGLLETYEIVHLIS